MLGDYDGNAMYAELEAKLRAGGELSDAEMLNLILLPLMKSDRAKYEIAESTMKLTEQIEDETKRDICIASTFAFMEKYLNKDELKKIWEVIKVTKVATMLIEEGIEQGIEIGSEKTAEKTAENMLKKNKYTIEEIAEATELSVESGLSTVFRTVFVFPCIIYRLAKSCQ